MFHGTLLLEELVLLERGGGVGKGVRPPRPCSRTCPEASAGATGLLTLADAEAEAIAFPAEGDAFTEAGVFAAEAEAIAFIPLAEEEPASLVAGLAIHEVAHL